MSSADRRSPPGLCGSRIHLGGRVAKQLQNAFSVYFFFSPVQPASGADGRTSENTNFAASFEGLFGPNQGYFSSIFSMGDVGSSFFWFLGRRGSLSSVDRLQVFQVEWKLVPLSLCHQTRFDCLRVNPQRRIIA